MKKNTGIFLIILLLMATQNYSNAYIMYTPNSDIKFNYISYDYDKLLAFGAIPSNMSDINAEKIILDIDSDMSVAKIIDDNFSLEMDLDVNAKKQIKPKANIIEGYKIDSKSSKCVEKVMKPHVKKYKIQEENIIGDEIENIDVDQITDIKAVAVKQKQERIAKEKKQRQERIAKANQQKKERTGLLSWFRRDKTRIAKADNTVPPEIEDIDNVTPNKEVNKIAQVNQDLRKNLTKNTTSIQNPKTDKSQEVITNEVFDADKIDQPKLQQKHRNEHKKEEMRIAKENLKLAKPQKEKPVKVAKVNEPKAEKVKPVKVAKVAEPKVEKVKPVKVAKVAEPKVEKVKPVKVAKIKEPKPIKVKAEKTVLPKTEKLAKAEQPIQNIDFVETQTENNEFDIDRNNKIVSKPQKPAKVIKQKPIKVREEKPVKVAKVNEPKVEKVKPVKVAKVNEPKVEKVKPVKVAKVNEPKAEKVKPVKVAKVSEPKAVKVKTEKVKPVKVAVNKQQKNIKENKIQQPVSMPVVNNTILTNATLASAFGKKSTGGFSSIYTQNQISKNAFSVTGTNRPVNTVSTQPKTVKPEKIKPVKVAKVSEPKAEKVKPVKIAKVAEPKVEKVKPVKVAKVAEPKVEKIKPVKVAKVAEPKVEKVKPVKVAKVAEPKVEKVKPVKVAKTKSIETKGIRTVANRKLPVQKQENIKPVAQVKVLQASRDLYKINKPQETPVYSAFETMQNRLPLTKKPFDTDDI